MINDKSTGAEIAQHVYNRINSVPEKPNFIDTMSDELWLSGSIEDGPIYVGKVCHTALKEETD